MIFGLARMMQRSTKYFRKVMHVYEGLVPFARKLALTCDSAKRVGGRRTALA
jgi:hypothetical protein